MSTTTETIVMGNQPLSPGVALALGDLLNAITQKRKIRWMDRSEVIRSGELRSLVRGENDFGFAPFGTDVRDMHVWISTGVGEVTESVGHLVTMLPQGGLEIIEPEPPANLPPRTKNSQPNPDYIAAVDAIAAAAAQEAKS